MPETELKDVADRLAREYGAHVLRRASWSKDELRVLIQGVADLARLMGGAAEFRRQLGRVLMWRAPFRTSIAAMAAPLLDVVYFEGASWGDEPEFLWQTVHELAHVWDIHSFYGLSRGLKRATSSKYGRFKWQSPIPFEYEPGGDWLQGRPSPLNALEDWADSVATYVYPDQAGIARGGPRLISPVRWYYVRERMQIRLPYPTEWVAHFHGPEGSGTH
jgi:hypothetical protein